MHVALIFNLPNAFIISNKAWSLFVIDIYFHFFSLTSLCFPQFVATLGASMAVGGWAVGIGIGSLCVDQLSRGIGGFVLTEEQQVWTGQ